MERFEFTFDAEETFDFDASLIDDEVEKGLRMKISHGKNGNASW